MRIASLLVPLLFAASLAAAEVPPPTLFRAVHVVALDSGPASPPRDVLVRDGRIAAIADAGSIESGDGIEVVEASGRFLMPGLVEMHAHVPAAAAPQLQAVLDLFLANGVTTLRGVLGEPGQLALREEIARGDRIAPRLYTAGPSLNGNSAAEAEAAIAMVEAQKRAGYDLLKLHPGFDMARHDAIVATAKRVGIPVAGHVSEAVGLEHALAQGIGTVEHLDDYVRALVPADAPERTASPGFFGVDAALAADETRIPVLVKATIETGAFVVPTETLMVHLLGGGDVDELLTREEYAYVSDAVKQQWRRTRAELRAEAGPEKAARFLALRAKLIAALYAEGRVLAGADAPQMFNVPGFALHRELALMVASGATPPQVLRSATRQPAAWLGAGERRGRIAVGQDADLALLQADPVIDIDNTRRIVGVMAAGRWLDRAALDARLEAARRTLVPDGR
jgi:imidazolonepropionase-like amidohydrolase